MRLKKWAHGLCHGGEHRVWAGGVVELDGQKKGSRVDVLTLTVRDVGHAAAHELEEVPEALGAGLVLGG